MSEIPQEAYKAANVAAAVDANHDLWTRRAVDVVWPLAVAAGRREAAQAIRAAAIAKAISEDGGEWAAGIAEGQTP